MISQRVRLILSFTTFMTVGFATALAQIGTEIIERNRAALQRQATDPVQKRERGTSSEDWLFALPPDVTSRQVVFYSDGAPCYARLFFPKGFTTTRKWPAVVVGHGINAQAVGIEKYAARFAERGLVSMAIDYRTYGYSSGDVLLLDPDTSTDKKTLWEKDARIQIKRTNLNNFREAEDFQAGISYLQGEPGVDADNIGIWGSSNGASVVLMVAAIDPRVKAIVAQVGAASGLGVSAPVPIPPQMLEDGIRRARTGQGAEVDGGFSFRSKIDLYSNQNNREFRPAMWLDRIPVTTKILWLPVEKDELIPGRGVQVASKAFKGVSQVIEIPYLTHFQAYSYAGFEVGSNLAADWFLKYLTGDAGKPKPVSAASSARGLATVRVTSPAAIPGALTAKDVTFYSDGIRCHGQIFSPKTSAGRHPAVVLAPGMGQTAESLTSYAIRFAERGIVAMTLDYRGWGRSGGYLQTVNEVKTDDRLRFSQMTARVRIHRKRILPSQQILDIRNALYFLQGEPNVDRARVGVWGVDLAAAHVLVVAATDARIRAVVSEALRSVESYSTGEASHRSADLHRAELLRARKGWLAFQPVASNSSGIDLDSRLALEAYRPFWYLNCVPPTTAVLFVDAEKDGYSGVARKLLKGTPEVTVVPGLTAWMTRGTAFDMAADAAAAWFLKHL